jgi:hypothetical protein
VVARSIKIRIKRGVPSLMGVWSRKPARTRINSGFLESRPVSSPVNRGKRGVNPEGSGDAADWKLPGEAAQINRRGAKSAEKNKKGPPARLRVEGKGHAIILV